MNEVTEIKVVAVDDIDCIEDFAVGSFRLSDGRSYRVCLNYFTRDPIQIEYDVDDDCAIEAISAFTCDEDDREKNKQLGRIALSDNSCAIAFRNDGRVYNNVYNTCEYDDVGAIYNHQLLDFEIEKDLKDWMKENNLEEIGESHLIEFLKSYDSFWLNLYKFSGDSDGRRHLED